jgi:hypothetical protein
MKTQELLNLIPWKTCKEQCQAYYDSQFNNLVITEEQYKSLLHLLCGGWEPDCVDMSYICKTIDKECRCMQDNSCHSRS